MSDCIHAFVICAYKEGKYLEDCVKSLVNQSTKSKIVISTSTPNSYISGIADKYGIDVIVNDGPRGITEDWNFAYGNVDAKYLTIAHHDDYYHEDFAKDCIEYLENSGKPLICFTDYAEAREGRVVTTNKLLRTKRLMLWPLKFRIFRKSRFVRRRVLSLGDPICCPSVTFAKENLPEVIFANHFRSDEDWEAWEKLSKLKGSFIYINKILTYHRIHSDSETTAILADNQRSAEDYEMYRKFWPKPIARFLTKRYSKSEQSNNL